jgi:hypothetical protein
MYQKDIERNISFKEEEDEEHIHSRKSREKWLDDDALSIEEDGFLEGFEEDAMDLDTEEHYCKFDEHPATGGI